MSNLYPHLLSPGRIGSMELKNRIAVTAMESACPKTMAPSANS